MQPIYYKSSFKINARKENIAIYRRITGVNSIPIKQDYWTLCNYQPPESGSEIVQLMELGFLKESQFCGIDRDEEIIKQNRIWHPNARWYVGEWIDVIESQPFNPAMIYLDTTTFVDHWVSARLVTRTMMLCPRKTVMIVNAMLNDPRSSKRFDPYKLLKNIVKEVPSIELKKWDLKVENYNYSSTGKTDLISYVFYKL